MCSTTNKIVKMAITCKSLFGIDIATVLPLRDGCLAMSMINKMLHAPL